MQSEKVNSQIDSSMIMSELIELGNHFQPNELAYLALTGKIELPIRDKLAFILHKRLNDKGYTISREWIREQKRFDLAIVKEEVPIILIELKAMYTFNGMQNYAVSVKNMIESDLDKCKELAKTDTKVYAILLATHPHEKVKKELKGVVKYIDEINKTFGDEREICTNCRNAVTKLFSEYKVESDIIEAGECFGIKVSLLFWLIQPFAQSRRKRF